MMLKPTLYALSLVLIFLNGNAYAQVKDDYTSKIDSVIRTTSPRGFNGVILITQKGKVKYSKAYGYADVDKKIPLTIKDNFRIQSNSKQITAVLILKQVEKGKVDLNSPVRKYLPGLTQPWADSVTVHQLLNFSSGITDVNKPLAFKPGTDYLYTVVAYTMLGNIVESVTGKTFVETANALFKEMGMNNTFCYEKGKNDNKFLKGYISSNDGFRLNTVDMSDQEWIDFIPAGGMISNATDLNLWDTKLHGGKILKPESYKSMTTYNITAQHESFGDQKIGYGYGVRVNDKSTPKYIGHSGKGFGLCLDQDLVSRKGG